MGPHLKEGPAPVATEITFTAFHVC